MKYAQIRMYDVANGEGIRETVFFSGCKHNCYNCFNKEYQNFNYGEEYTKEVEDKIIENLKNENISGLSILGGEPFQQDSKQLLSLVKRVKEEVNKSIWLWTGYEFERIPNEYNDVLDYIDVLIDGKFIENLKDIRLKWRGSSNQRIIDVQGTLRKGHIIERIDLY